jgi:uncharacterized protein YcbX
MPAMDAVIAHLRRYPVKGLSGEDMPAVELEPGKALPMDRRYALLHGAATHDPGHQGWRPKTDFLTLARHEKLAALDTAFDEATQTLIIRRGGRPVMHGRIDQPVGRSLIEQFFAAYMAGAALGMPRLIDAGEGAFTDSEEPVVAILNLASVHDLERVVKEPVDPRRFRANILLDRMSAWQERGWIGRTIQVGTARLEVIKPIDRCQAIEVDPVTGRRDLNLMAAMRRGYGRLDCGVFARVTQPGRVAVGDPVIVE